MQHILSPIQIGQSQLRNRIIMGSMHTRLEYCENGVERQKAFYEARAKGGAAMIITGGFAPNEEGSFEDGSGYYSEKSSAEEHKTITQAVQKHGCKMLLQILHTGRYGRHEHCVAPSEIRAPINPFPPRALSEEDIERTIEDYISCALFAERAGYDGVEIMGSEGYLINQFTAERTNKRTDKWGGSIENRHRFPVEIVKRVRAALQPSSILMYRISALDLVEGGATAEEIDILAQKIEEAGADVFNTGIGWHEAQIPTIASSVPRAAWRFATARLRQKISIPIIASNRINTPELAEEILASGGADLISMARPFLADPDFVNKAAANKSDEINACIACNQACLDYIFREKTATCLVNPRACRETILLETQTKAPKNIAVIGAGAAGLSFATSAAARGHNITLYEANDNIGGQINLAKVIPGKDEFDKLLRYYRVHLDKYNVTVKLNHKASADELAQQGYDHVVISSGVAPRIPEIEGVDHRNVITYAELLSGEKQAGKNCVIIGTGGIGYDVAEFLITPQTKQPDEFLKEWGVDKTIQHPGGLIEGAPDLTDKTITLFQRSSTKPGRTLGATTGWVLRSTLRKHKVQFVTGATYQRIDNDGLHYTKENELHTCPADTIILCAGQISQNALESELNDLKMPNSIIGGAEKALEIDAMRAIEAGLVLAEEL